MIEVEVKAKINNIQAIKENLKKLNLEKKETEIQEDIYFEREDIKFALNDKALRIRSIEKNGKKYTKITYKGPKLDKISKTREEIELEVENKDKIKKLFERLLFIESGHVKKIREIYEYFEKEDEDLENMKFEIAIDNVEGLGYYMEIETDLENEKTEIAIEKIYKLFKELGIENGFERTSYLELLEKEN